MSLTDLPKLQIPSLLHKLGKMTAIRDTALLEQSLLKTLCPMLGVLDSSLYRIDDLTSAVRVLHHHHSRIIESDGMARLVERNEEIFNEANIDPEINGLLQNVRLLGKPCTRKSTETPDQLLIAYPLFGGREICGVLLFARDREVTLTEDAIIKGVLEVYANYYELLDISQRDRLTGLLNRQALENSFERIWTILSRSNGPAHATDGRRGQAAHAHWIAVIDVDHFKNVNDTFGHVVGDEVLLLISRLMMAELRASDLLFRYGGEEFVLLFSAKDAEDAATILERLRLSIARHSFPQVGHVTISVGLSLADPNDLPQEVLSWADRALYQAKKTGRNRICDYQSLRQRGEVDAPTYGGSELF